MTTYYVSSVSGVDDGGRDGQSKANAWATLAYADGIVGAGDILLVDSAHEERVAGSGSWTFTGTAANPVVLISVDWSTEVYEPGATFGTTYSNSMSLNGQFAMFGMVISSGRYIGPNTYHCYMFLRSCTIELGYGGYSSSLYFGGIYDNQYFDFIDVVFKSHHASGYFALCPHSVIRWRGGKIDSSVAAPNVTMFAAPTNDDTLLHVENVDFSECGSSINMFGALTSRARANFTLINCALPATAGSYLPAITNWGTRVELTGCGTVDYPFGEYLAHSRGTVVPDASVYRTASGVSHSQLYSGDTDADRYVSFGSKLCTLPGVDLSGGSVDVTVYAIQVSESGTPTALTDAEFWIDVYATDNTTESAMALVQSTRCGPTDTPANLTSSSESWTESATYQTLQEITVTIPQAANVDNGTVEIFAYCAANLAINVCPVAVLS